MKTFMHMKCYTAHWQVRQFSPNPHLFTVTWKAHYIAILLRCQGYSVSGLCKLILQPHRRKTATLLCDLK